MILPTLNGESVDPTGQPALKTEERTVNGLSHVLGGRQSGKGVEPHCPFLNSNFSS